ncbi:MAG: ABC-F family ATP-binding cassette domain-containing protein [Cytophagaceae bacterium]|jgi:ATP-binding cassette subfamily F protein 3|nr:ABC-F family ATP-binding cassette domain-containing protein [Cytophagaceae bacterium]
MLTLNNISYFIGGRALYQNATLQIQPKDKIGLIGANGTGKTTLLRIITGEYSIDEGTVQKSKDCTIGYLNQDLLSFQSDDSILAVAMKAFSEAMAIQVEMDHLLEKMETHYTDALIDKLSKLQERFQALEGYTIQSSAEKILEGLGFSSTDLQRPLRTFSGGWRMRVILAQMLLAKPSLLLLDEPTNHLDLPSIQWLENYLQDYEGAVIIVSHDRAFLNQAVTKIVEVAQQQLTVYEGNYDFYLEERTLRKEIQKAAFENQQAKIRQTERFIERFRAQATKAKQVQSRVKSLERIDMIEDIVEENQHVNFKFQFKISPGRTITELKEVSKAYGALQILQKSSGRIERGDKIALIGANGRGKSTLLRIISGSEAIDGEVIQGHNVLPSFFAQHQLESLDIENTLLDELKMMGSDKSETELRNVLGCFLFAGDDVFKKIKVLSGGEKSRVALAKTLISNANFLLLDEPTNHLDIVSVNILIQALQQYEGTLVVVSHDRHFVSQVATKIWYIEDHQLKEYPGTFDEYTYWSQHQKTNTTPSNSTKDKPSQPNEKPKVEKKDGLNKKVEQDIKKAEEKITLLEVEKRTIEEELSKVETYTNPDKLAEFGLKLQTIEDQLLEWNKRWESLLESLE